MKKTSSLTVSVLASVILFATVTPVSANGFTGLPEQLTPMEMRGKYVDKMDLQSKNVLGFFYTKMDGSTDARIHNIKKAMKRLNGMKVKPLEGFSYNKTVGNSNLAEEGWQKAGVIANGQLVEGYGGGICQVSSTLFNAVVEAGLTVVERHTHSKTVGYVPVGMDATVAYGYMDFQFVNPYDFDVKIKAKVYNDNQVVIAIVRA
ncbi:VanW family protein [Brevibacillus choshinensis]|uniref:VanW family protein n=1 Tax=Brevibacillus choshinensis TaxID=54911 RepID=UPI002E1C59A7|nr:VanW family protein [Brevibacillus choshinensis]MED4783083.1 VanW family protein [Brevibacillus choshinensis]